MKEIIIRKGDKIRVVYSPGSRMRKRLSRMLTWLQDTERTAARAAGTEDVAHGFVRGRSPVSCADCHRGFAVTISCDLSSWFDSVRLDQIAEGLALAGYWLPEAMRLARPLCAYGSPLGPFPGELAPRQGLPTSPTAANLAAVPFDLLVLDMLSGSDLGEHVYTRYADDIMVSLNRDDQASIDRVKSVIEDAAGSMGWTIASHKTHVQYARAGRRVLVGIAVDDYLFPTRRTRRKLRAALHQSNDVSENPKSLHPLSALNSARGLSEWCLLRQPKSR